MMNENERQIALREAAMISASDEYFNARPGIDDNHSRRVFDAGFERGHRQGHEFKAVVIEELKSMGLYKPEYEFDANKAISALVGARARSGAPFDDVCNIVARDLPPGWLIEVSLELDSGSVTLYDNSGETFRPSPDFSMQEKVEAALRIANGGEE